MATFHRAQNTRERDGRRNIATSFSEMKVQQFLAIIPEMTIATQSPKEEDQGEDTK
jgi:hypothetical protein